MDSQQLLGKSVPRGLRDIFPVRDVRDIQSVVLVAEIVLHKPGEVMLVETENLVN